MDGSFFFASKPMFASEYLVFRNVKVYGIQETILLSAALRGGHCIAFQICFVRRP